MAKTKSKSQKPLSKGQRTHVRRLKQAARKEANPNSPRPSPAQPVQAPKQKDQA